MSRIQATLLAILFLGVQICCAPPMRAAAFEAVEPSSCPMDRDMPCQAGQQQECSGGPELIATSTDVPAVTPLVIVVPAAHPHQSAAHLAGLARDDFWSAQTKTIQLRI
jgi:hypothetical protein